MSRGITANDVWQAADELLQAGERPTIERVRLKMGRGSPNTVSPHLDGWFASLGARLDTAVVNGQGKSGAGRLAGSFDTVDATNPDEAFTLAASTFWQLSLTSARHAVEASLSEVRTALTQQAEDLKQAQDKLELKAQRMAARQEGLERALHGAEHQRAEAAQRAASLDAQLNVLQQQREKERAALIEERQQLAQRSLEQERHWQLELERTREAHKQQMQQAQQQVERVTQERLVQQKEAVALQQRFEEREQATQAKLHQLLSQLHEAQASQRAQGSSSIERAGSVRFKVRKLRRNPA
ncbi:Plasmid replication region DNA-binding protein [Leptothrix ochracea L12]|uniref:Plasmid replication region DNA-binding protein n=1 Tax=Leptothrix ochracea L12 TaxID=735332 RepID=I4Z5V7_9BURK|nr:DNA-binding protein [Leptothrix ochracea]EIM31599.1 Plasmid replication region DNA-binding protein [Leptothrix ochracea L12]